MRNMRIRTTRGKARTRMTRRHGIPVSSQIVPLRAVDACARAHRPVAERVESKVPMAATRTVLIVDDDPQMLRLVEKMLRARNVKLLGAPRPSEALRICESEPVHVLISDVAMPEMDGNRLAGLVLKMHPEAHVLLISGRHTDPPLAAKSDRV